jgi:hypothetical protein
MSTNKFTFKSLVQGRGMGLDSDEKEGREELRLYTSGLGYLLLAGKVDITKCTPLDRSLRPCQILAGGVSLRGFQNLFHFTSAELWLVVEMCPSREVLGTALIPLAEELFHQEIGCELAILTAINCLVEWRTSLHPIHLCFLKGLIRNGYFAFLVLLWRWSGRWNYRFNRVASTFRVPPPDSSDAVVRLANAAHLIFSSVYREILVKPYGFHWYEFLSDPVKRKWLAVIIHEKEKSQQAFERHQRCGAYNVGPLCSVTFYPLSKLLLDSILLHKESSLKSFAYCGVLEWIFNSPRALI